MRQPSTAVALVAIVLACASTATAAKVKAVTGANFKRASLTGVDLKTNTLVTADFSKSAQLSMKGATGKRGENGDLGIAGPTGIQGSKGVPGKPARVASAWSWFDSRYLTVGADNSGAADWSTYNGGDGVDHLGNLVPGNLQWTNGLNRTFETALSLDSPNCNGGDVQGTDCAWGANDGGGVTVAWDTNITASAELSILFMQDDDIREDGAPVHVRTSCYLAANRGTGSTDFDQIGARADISGIRQRQVDTISLVGSINRDASKKEDYMVRVECRDADGTDGRTRFYVLSGSLSVIATERG